MAEESTLTVVEPAIVDLSPGASRSYDTPIPPVTPEKPAEEAKPAEPEPSPEEAEEAAAKAIEEGTVDTLPIGFKRAATRLKNAKKTLEAALAAKDAQVQQALAIAAEAQKYIPKPGDKQEPRWEQYDGDQDKFMNDRAEWLADRRMQAMDSQRQQDAQKKVVEQIEADYDRRLIEAEVKYPGISHLGRGLDAGFAAVVSPGMAAAIKQSEMAPDLVNYLNEHREEAARIYSLNPARAAAEIGKIEATLSIPKPKPKPPEKPIEPLGGRGTLVKNKDDPGLTSDEWWALVEAERAADLVALKKRLGH